MVEFVKLAQFFSHLEEKYGHITIDDLGEWQKDHRWDHVFVLCMRIMIYQVGKIHIKVETVEGHDHTHIIHIIRDFKESIDESGRHRMKIVYSPVTLANLEAIVCKAIMTSDFFFKWGKQLHNLWCDTYNDFEHQQKKEEILSKLEELELPIKTQQQI